MSVLARRETATLDTPHFTQAELNHEWQMAKVSFDQALIQKTETDRIYVDAATRLNAIERMVKEVERRAAVARRAAGRALMTASQVGIHAVRK